MAGFVSGGEQQMCVIGRAMMAKPKLMLLDEPSMGLAPLLIKEIFEIIQRLNREEKIPILLVEQNVKLALTVAPHAYVMENGRIVMDDTSEKLKENPDIRDFYLGLTDVGGRKSFRYVKHYKRRKRWITWKNLKTGERRENESGINDIHFFGGCLWICRFCRPSRVEAPVITLERVDVASIQPFYVKPRIGYKDERSLERKEPAGIAAL